MQSPEQRHYWKTNIRFIGILLAIWAAVSLGAGILLVKPLNVLTLGALPLGFWVAQQGAIYVFVLLIFVYAWRMDRIDRQHHLDNRRKGPDA